MNRVNRTVFTFSIVGVLSVGGGSEAQADTQSKNATSSVAIASEPLGPGAAWTAVGSAAG